MRSTLALSLLGTLALVASVPAAAVSPDGHDHGMEPTRVHAYNVQTQLTLRDSVSWQAFTQGEGETWIARFDEVTGEPLRAWGRGIDVGPLNSEADAINAVRAFVGRNAQAFSTSPKLLGGVLGGLGGGATANYDASQDAWYVDIPAVHEGIEVYRGGVTARFKRGKLVMIGVQTYAEVPRLGQQVLSDAEAIQTAIDLGPASGALHTNRSAELVWLPFMVDGELSLVRAWEVHSITDEPVGEWVSFVDAETGELLNVHNDVRFVDGRIQADINPRLVTDSLVSVPIKDAWVSGDGFRATTDDGGNFSIGTASYTFEMRGPDLTLREGLNGNNVPTWRNLTATNVLVQSSSTASQSALNTWVAIQDVQDFYGAVAPEITVGDNRGGPQTANVNTTGGTCNAFYSPQNGSVNFYRTGGGCNATGLIADIVYHEWGHGFHFNSVQSGQYDSSLGEGAADTVAFTLTDNNIIGPTFRTDGGGIRNVEPDRRYPEQYSNQQAPHTNGLIFAGAMWDLIRELEGRYSRDEAREVVAGLLAGALKGGPTVATSGDEVLFADDDDGDLSNGTPHYCEIVAAFEPHGLAPQAGIQVAVQHDQLVEANPGEVDIVATGGGLSLDCLDLGNVQVTYRADGGSWQSAPMSRSGDDFTASLDLPYGTFVEYYLAAGGAEIPSGGVRNPLSLYVGGVLDVWSTDFEADDGGFTSELLAGDDRAGANDWQWGTPNATPDTGRGSTVVSGDPDGAWSGDNAWGNDLGNVVTGEDGNPQYWNGVYQGDRHNRLSSPPIAVPEHLEGVFLRYARWLTVEDGFFDQANILADGEIVWTNYNSKDQNAAASHEDRQWVIHSVDIDDAAADGEVVLSWEIVTDQGAHFGGWNLDDVQVVAPATPNNRLAITDLVAGDDEEGGVTVSWTNPKYAPLQSVIVVRKEGELPTGPDDGEVVWVDENPELGAPNSTVDTGGKNGRVYWYAAYGDDGSDTLGWTVAGWNADEGSGNGINNGVAGCSCNSTPSGGHLAWLGLGGLVFFLRRRRS